MSKLCVALYNEVELECRDSWNQSTEEKKLERWSEKRSQQSSCWPSKKFKADFFSFNSEFNKIFQFKVKDAKASVWRRIRANVSGGWWRFLIKSKKLPSKSDIWLPPCLALPLLTILSYFLISFFLFNFPFQFFKTLPGKSDIWLISYLALTFLTTLSFFPISYLNLKSWKASQSVTCNILDLG